MPLTVAVQMDPIERIRIAGDFDLRAAARSAGARARAALLYARPAQPRGRAAARRGPAADASGTSRANTPASARRARVDLAELDVVLLRQDPPFDLAYIATTHLLERIHPRTLVVNDPRAVRDAPEKLFVMDFPELMPPTLISRERAAIEAFRAEHGDVVMKPLYGAGGAAVFKIAPARRELRLAVRPLLRHFPRALGHPEVPAGGRRGRQAHHPRRRRAARRGQPRAGRRRHPLQHGARRRGARRPS